MTEAVIVEVRSGEGGKDAKLLASKLVKIYEKYGDRRGL